MTRIAAVRKEKDIYLSNFAQLERELSGQQPAWVQQVRKRAILSFQETGFPTPRDEEWKYTNVAPLARIDFQPAQPAGDRSLEKNLERFRFANLQCRRLVFVNGFHAPELSSQESPPAGLRVGSLASAISENPHFLQAHLARYATFQEHAFNALNTAFIQDGAFIHVPKGCIVQEPIHLLFLSSVDSQPTVSHPRNLIVTEENTQLTVIEHYLSRRDGVHFTNPVTELVVGENAVVEHYKLQQENEDTFHVATLQFYQGGSSSLASHSITLGGNLVRNNLNAVLDGEGADCVLNGLYLLGGEQHVDNHTGIEHAKAHCTSRELYKGVLDGRARGVFHGRILVRPGAQKTDSKQTNKNLLLSNQALINTKPQLEIYADDVKCTHGATIGQLDNDAIFYLRSRGIGAEVARSLLIYAFAGEIVNRIKVEALRSQLDDFLFNWLPKGKLAQEAFQR